MRFVHYLLIRILKCLPDFFRCSQVPAGHGGYGGSVVTDVKAVWDHLLTTPLLPDVPQVQCPVQRCHVNTWPVSTLETGLAMLMKASRLAKSFKIWDIWQVRALSFSSEMLAAGPRCSHTLLQPAWCLRPGRLTWELHSLFWDQGVALHQISHAETQAPWATLSVGTTIISETKDLYSWHL